MTLFGTMSYNDVIKFFHSEIEEISEYLIEREGIRETDDMLGMELKELLKGVMYGMGRWEIVFPPETSNKEAFDEGKRLYHLCSFPAFHGTTFQKVSTISAYVISVMEEKLGRELINRSDIIIQLYLYSEMLEQLHGKE